jgi:hypothetical protein
MVEKMKEHPRKPNRLDKSLEFIFGKDDPSEDLEWLFADDRIERLVEEGRTPLNIGKIGTVGQEMQAYYQVPPRGFEPKDIVDVYSSMGCYVFVHRTGIQRVGATYTLNVEQVEEMEARISSVKSKNEVK